MFGKDRTNKLEVELARSLGSQRAADIVRELGPEIISNPVIEGSPEFAAEALRLIAMTHGPGASAREIAADFVEQMLGRLRDGGF